MTSAEVEDFFEEIMDCVGDPSATLEFDESTKSFKFDDFVHFIDDPYEKLGFKVAKVEEDMDIEIETDEKILTLASTCATNGPFYQVKLPPVITPREFFKLVEDAETIIRQDKKAEWFGGIDTHHRFYEGGYVEGKDRLTICWGS